MTVLEDLWYGNIAPSEQFLSDNLHFKKIGFFYGQKSGCSLRKFYHRAKRAACEI